MTRQRDSSTLEKDLYGPILRNLQTLLAQRFSDTHLEITANHMFSNRLKSQIPQHRDLIFNFLKEAAPDITGFVKGDYSADFIVVEVKNGALKLDDIYQTRKYAELFDARYAILVSPHEISEELKRLDRLVYSLLSLPGYKKLTLAQFDTTEGFSEWFPENPFAGSYNG